jgi:cytochrome oxidase assembly protein ShyY1
VPFVRYNSLTLKTLFSRKWRIATILIIAAVIVQVLLAVWQVERLQERRACNARVQYQLDQPPLDLFARQIVASNGLIHAEMIEVLAHSQPWPL